MMIIFGIILYGLLAALIFLFWRQVKGRSLDDLFALDRRLHEHVHKVIAGHPHGGTWRQHHLWMSEDKPSPAAGNEET